MSISLDVPSFRCATCALCTQATIKDTTRHVCGARPPSGGGKGGFGLPYVTPGNLCTFWTDANGAQPIRRLAPLYFSQTSGGGEAQT